MKSREAVVVDRVADFLMVRFEREGGLELHPGKLEEKKKIGDRLIEKGSDRFAIACDELYDDRVVFAGYFSLQVFERIS